MFASPLGEKLAFYSMTGREALGRLFTYEVDLLSDDDSIDLSKLLGQSASVLLERTDGSLREFNGFVTHFSLVGEHGNFARYRAVLRPWLWLLGQNQNSRIFQAQTVPEIVKLLVKEYGFSDIEEQLSAPSYRTWEYLVQYRESDLNLVSRILEQEGIHYFFRHADGRHTLVLADSNNAHKPSPGYEEVPYFPPLARERRLEEHLDHWVTSMQIRPGAFALADYNFTKPAQVKGAKRAPFEHAHAEYEVFDYPGEFVENEEGDSLARLRLEEHQVEHETLQGGGPVRGLQAGSHFKLTQFPREDQNREYLVVSASYEIRVSEYESNIVVDVEPNFQFKLTAIDAKRPYRVPRLTRKPRVEGPQTAIVVGKENQEIWTDNYGRVKVQFYWDRLGQFDEESSCWVRVSQLWAGTQWGGIHIPRIGQEVIVDFLEGDPDRPIITGRVYNQDQMPPYTLPDNQTQSGIKSHSTKGGAPDNFNEIRFEDKKGEEEIHVQAEKDMTTLIKHDRTTNILRNDTLTITGDQFIKIHGNLSMIVEGVTEKDNPDKAKPVKSSLGVTGAHRLDASDTIDIQAPNKITLTVGSSSITITPGSITISAGGSTIVVDPDVFAKSKGEAQFKLDGEVSAKAKGEGSLTLSGDVVAQSKGGSQMKLDGDASLTTGGTVGLKGQKVTGKGDMEAGLDGGGSTVTLAAASADLSGAQVNVNGKGVVSIGGPMVKIG
jgi:type VI secretion system secreted protein VgrG